MKVMRWKRLRPPEAWATYSPSGGVVDPTAGSKEEMAIKLAAMGYELDRPDPRETNDVVEVWNVRKLPENP